jgi:hypothetical protein
MRRAPGRLGERLPPQHVFSCTHSLSTSVHRAPGQEHAHGCLGRMRGRRAVAHDVRRRYAPELCQDSQRALLLLLLLLLLPLTCADVAAHATCLRSSAPFNCACCAVRCAVCGIFLNITCASLSPPGPLSSVAADAPAECGASPAECGASAAECGAQLADTYIESGATHTCISSI